MPMSNQNPLNTTKPLTNLNKDELRKMAEGSNRKYSVTVFQTEQGFWTLVFAFDDLERYGLETVRHLLKVWRNVNDALLYAKENCGNASTVHLIIHGWLMVRSETT